MANGVCGPSFGVCAIRVTRVDGLGNVIAGSNAYVSNNPISVAQGVNKETGTSFSLRNGCGCGLSRFKAPDVFNWFEFTLTVAEFEPILESFLLGAATIEDGSDVVGVAYPSALTCGDEEPAVAFEFWTQHINGSAQDTVFPWLHHVYPMTIWSLDASTYEEDFNKPSYTAFSRTNDNWGDGPYGDGPPDSELAPEGDKFWTDVEPPTAECASQSVTSTS